MRGESVMLGCDISRGRRPCGWAIRTRARYCPGTRPTVRAGTASVSAGSSPAWSGRRWWAQSGSPGTASDAPRRLDRVEFVGVRRQPVDGQTAIASAMARLTVGVQVVPDQHDQPAQLPVGGVEQGGEI